MSNVEPWYVGAMGEALPVLLLIIVVWAISSEDDL
jgi:hypothetical protein